MKEERRQLTRLYEQFSCTQMWLQMKSPYPSHKITPQPWEHQILLPLVSVSVLWGKLHHMNSWTSQGSHWTKLAPGYPCACTAPAANYPLLLCPGHQYSPCFEKAPSCEFSSLKWPHGRITWVIICQALFLWHRIARLRG